MAKYFEKNFPKFINTTFQAVKENAIFQILTQKSGLTEFPQ